MLKLVSYKKENNVSNSAELHADRYFQSFRVKNYSSKTISRDRNFLEKWFQLHGTIHRPMYAWEAMTPIYGRNRILNYSNAMIDSEISPKTIRSYLGILTRYFSYILEYPYFIDGDTSETIQCLF